MSGFPAFPDKVKGGDPANAYSLENLQTLPATTTVWAEGNILIPNLATGEYKLCDAAGSTLKGIGIAGVGGKIAGLRMGSLYLPPCVVYSKYTQATVLKNLTFVKTRADGTFETTSVMTDAFAQILGKFGQGGGGGEGLTSSNMTDIVQNDFVKLRLLDI